MVDKVSTIGDEWINQRERQFPADLTPLPTDMRNAGAAEQAFNAAPIGEPPADFSVRSIYDSRPVQGFDFNQILSTGATSVASSEVSFDVPPGLVAVVRKVHIWIEPLIVLTSRSNVLFSLATQHARVQYNENIPVGDENLQPLEFFLIVDENQSVGAFVTLNVPSAINVFMHFYGNFLVKTGRAAPFEIANKVGETKLALGTLVSTGG